MQITNSDQFLTLEDNSQGYIDPRLLSDFKFGNQRGARKNFKDLVASIKNHGRVNATLIIRKDANDASKLEVIAGHGRRDAAIEANVFLVPFEYREVDDQTAFDIHMSDNLDREDLDIIAKVHAFTCYLTQFSGDYEATASRVNMEVPKLRRYLELNKCSDAVKDAIREEKISPSHGLVLAPFPHTVQDKNVSRIIEEKWSVAELKKRTGKVKLVLSQAKFDTSACASCEHNTYPQMDLLSGMDDEAKCANASCFQEKTTEYVASKKIELSEQYGTIILLSETSNDNRETVGDEIVGKAQFENCQTCQSHVTVMDDRIGHEETITEHQCVDKVCFTKCQTAHRLAVEEAKQEEQTINSSGEGLSQAGNGTRSTPVKAKTSKVATQSGKLSTGMVNAYDAFATSNGLSHFKDQPDFIHSMVTGALVAMTKHGHKRFDDAVAEALTMTADERNALVVQIVSHELGQDSQLMDGTMTQLIKKCLVAKSEETIPMLVSAWKPCKDTLSIYTIKQLGQLGEAAEFNKTLDAEKEGSFSKLLKSGKASILKKLSESSHDFSGFIPSSILKHLYPSKLLGKSKKTPKTQQTAPKSDAYLSVPKSSTTVSKKETADA